MNCASCGRINPAHARFCGGCGVALASRCPSCGAECEVDTRFCTSCGSPRDAAPASVAPAVAAGPPAVARKVVTVVFADLIGSVALHERLDAESGRRETERYHRTMAAAVDVHGGRVVQLLGDGVLAAFGVPRVAEDDAIRAVRAAVGMQRAFREMVRAQGESGPLAGVGLRVAVNTGEMVVGDDETVIGDTTNVAARLQHEARDGDVIVGEGTQRLIEDLVTLAPLGAFALRGRAETVRAWRVVSLERPASARATPFVGRDAELGRLLAVYESAVAARAARLAVLLGSPGLGKSRLVAEVARRTGERATVLSARCDAAGGATFAPLAEALRGLLGIEDGAGGDALRAAIDAVGPGDDAERARIASGIAALFSGAPSSPEETFFAVRRLLAGLAAVRPVVLVVDDLQWAAPLLLDLVEHLVQWSSDVPLLVLAAARPELRDVRSSLATAGALVADAVTLGGLDAASSMRLAAGVVGAAELPAALVGRVLATSEGNPLFLAELVRMLVQDGVLRREGERWVTTVEVAQLDMPPTIGVLLAARIERLRPDERLILERAAVVGRQFSRAAVAHLAGGDPAQLDGRLEALERSELIEPDTGWFLGEPALRFHHVLIRDAAYRRLLKETRAELHERLAEWIAERVGESLEHEETLGWHFEQAHLHLRELGPLGDRGRALGERAARHLGAAGRRALARDDLALAAGLLGRAIDALDRGHAMRAELVPDWCEALLAAGEVERAADAIAELERVAGDSVRLRAWHACFAGQLAALNDPQALRVTAERVAAAAEVLAAADDAQGEAKAYSVHAGALARLGAMGACEAALDRALAAARRARDRRRANSVLAGAPVAALWGPSPVTRASGRCLDVVRVLRITQGAPAVEAVALRCQAVLEALRGRGEAARRMVASSRRMVEELGIAQQLLEADVFAGMIELLEGDAVAAESFLATAYAGLREHGLAIDAARAAALLGRALLAQGRAAEAETLSHDSESLAGDDLKAASAWRGVRAEALARRGDAAAAVELAQAAVEIAATTDALLDHADARMALAVALRAAGRGTDADVEERRATELWRAKGATLLLERAPAQARLDEPTDARPDAVAGRRPVRGNAATAEVARLEAAVLSRDSGAVEQVLEALEEVVHHAHGATWDRDGARTSIRMPARFDELAGTAAVPAPHVRENRATEHVRRLDAIWAAADVVAFGGIFAPELEVVHHPMGASYGYDASVLRFREMFDGPGKLDFRHVPLATLGDGLALCHVRSSSRGMVYQDIDAGAFEIDYFVVLRADTAARATHVEVFASDRLGDAVGRLYALHAQTAHDGRDEARSAAVARAVAVVVPMDLDAIRDVLDPDLAFDDHRRLGVGSSRGAERYVRGARLLLELTEQARNVTQEVLVATDRALLTRRALFGVQRDGGGAFELHLLMLWAFGDDGRITHVELFDADDDAGALARCAALGSDAPSTAGDGAPCAIPASDFAPDNAATRIEARMRAALAAHDRDAIERLFAPGFRAVDRRRDGLFEADREAYLAAFWPMFESLTAVRQQARHVATRGDRLSLGHVYWWAEGADGAGPVELEWLSVIEVDDQGRLVFDGEFDPGDVEAAYAELDARYAAGEDASHVTVLTSMRAFADAFARRDWGALAACCSGDLVVNDHRRLGWEPLHGVAPYVAALRALVELAPDTRMRLDHVEAAARGFLVRTVWTGTRDGGPFEEPSLMVGEVGDAGRVIRFDQYEPDGLAVARARFASIGEPAEADGIAGWVRPNAAVAARDRVERAIRAADWPAMQAAFAPGAVLDDRRRLFRMKIPAEQAVEAMRDTVARAPDFRSERRVLAVFGDRIALEQQTWRGTADGAAFEVEMLTIIEVDAAGRVVAIVDFDPDDRRDAIREANARWASLEPALAPLLLAAVDYSDATSDRDLLRIRGLLADDFVLHDRRRTGLGLVEGPDPFLATFRETWALTSRSDVEVIARIEIAPWGSLGLQRVAGTLRDGGAFESLSLCAMVFADGRYQRAELFEVDDGERALARFAALRAQHEARRDDPLRIPLNLAARVSARGRAFERAGDGDALRALCAPDMVFEDRRRLARVTGDLETFLENGRSIGAGIFRHTTRELLATCGDRLCLQLNRFSGTPESGEFELETLDVTEVDAAGRVVRILVFDTDERHAASVEMLERYMCGEGAQTMPPAQIAFLRAMQAHDLAAAHAALDDDFVLVDHRRTGVGRLAGADQYIASLAAVAAQAPDFATDVLYHVAVAEHGSMSVGRMFGTLREGGPFESLFVRINRYEDGRNLGVELFEIEDLERAKARFEELRAARRAASG